jgi:hypothetical protein
MLQYFEVGLRIELSNRNGVVNTASLLTVTSTHPHVAAYPFVFARYCTTFKLDTDTGYPDRRFFVAFLSPSRQKSGEDSHLEPSLELLKCLKKTMCLNN